MEQINGIVRDVDYVPVNGALVYVYDQFGQLSDIYFGDASPKDNPIVTPETGYWEAWVNDGLYTVKIHYGGRERYIKTGIVVGGSADLTLRGDLASTAPGLGDNLVADNDGAGGTLWTTVRGFITYLRSSVGSSIVGFIQAGIGAVPRTAQDKMRDIISALDFIPAELHADIQAGTSATNVAGYIQAAMDSLQASGGTVEIPRGIYYTTDKLTMRFGVSLVGVGHGLHYNGSAWEFYGSWIKFRSPTPEDGALYFHSVQNCVVQQIGIDCGEVANSTGIVIKSDNDPACKSHLFSDFTIFAADLAVQWGGADAESGVEQCDDITFRDFHIAYCTDGFRINATNAADYSVITRGTFSGVPGICVDFQKWAFMEISYCAAATDAGAVMFHFGAPGGSDPIRIIGCQNEPLGKFITTASGSNDQGTIILEGNVVNLPIEATGILRFASQNNYFNSTINLNGFVRWKSNDDCWDLALFSPGTKQVTLAGGAQFSAWSLKNALSYFTSYLPVNFHIENGEATAGGYMGQVVTREGIRALAFVPSATYAVGDWVVPATDNAHAYRCTVGGIAGAAPVWPTGSGATVSTGAVTFQEAGQSALLHNYGPIPLFASATFDPASLADGQGTTVQVVCTGAALGGFAEASFSLDIQGITVTAWVDQANVVSVRFQNETGGVIDLASGTLRVRVVNP